MTLADDLRTWTQANVRARRAYQARLLEIERLCNQCLNRERDGNHAQCQKCRKNAAKGKR